ncbi:MAG: hypothetical protein H6R10_635 [Rhodocyclaceae bacterium]|nr:hypothetical protein [Rhodocyclaceae bacterium]
MKPLAQHIRTLCAATVLPAVLASPLPALAAYLEENLVSDIPGLAPTTDPNLQNPWGISSSPTGPLWVSDNGTGVSTLYNSTGVKQPLTVTIPPPAGGTPPAAPTGQVFNSTNSFNLGSGGKAAFIFATEDGTLAAWNAAQGTAAQLAADNSASGAIYKGLAIGSVGNHDYLYATNFHAGTVDVFNGSFALTQLTGHFTDPNLPAGFAPFNIQNIGGKLYVTFAKQDANKEDDVAGLGNGFIDVFNLNGHLEKRLATQGLLNSPWGLALAPSGFGAFSKDLLVGNFGDGKIHAFDPHTGDLKGTLADAAGNPITIEGLWGLKFGNGGNGGFLNQLYFAAGIPGGGQIEDHGLFGKISATSVPEPSSLSLLFAALAAVAGIGARPARGGTGTA